MKSSSKDSNQKTLGSYETHIQEYINGTPQVASAVVKNWIDESIKDLPKSVHILELGSAFGRDAEYLQNLGYKVECSDATQAFVDLLKTKHLSARKLNAITDDLGGQYDLVLANAVLLHFTRTETKLVLNKVYKALNFSGSFAFTLKQGKGEEWSDRKLGAPRYFCYWEADQIYQMLADTGFGNIRVDSDKRTRDSTWIQVVATK